MVTPQDLPALASIVADTRLAPRVLYLEGRTDEEFLCALLGQSHSALTLGPGKGAIHQGVLIRGLESEKPRGRSPGSGSGAVLRLVRVAQENSYSGIFGVTDGDGTPLAALTASFDPPAVGPAFCWKAYCIENLIAQAAWPSAWGPAPVWSTALLDYAPYVAINQMRKDLVDHLESLRLARFIQPNPPPEALLDEATVKSDLALEKRRLLGYDVEAEFDSKVTAFRDTLARSIDEAHCLLNGKWLLRHLAPMRTRKTPDDCRREWLEAVRLAGGHPEVRAFWDRVFA